VVVARFDQDDPPCIQDAFLDLVPGSTTGTLLAVIQGRKGTHPDLPDQKGFFPMVSGDGCVVLTLIDVDVYEDMVDLIGTLVPMGVGTYGTPFEFDSVLAGPNYYGVGPEVLEAVGIKEQLDDMLLADERVLYIYVSPSIGFDQ